MDPHHISETRISSQRFYAVIRESKIKFYTTSVAAARYWVKNCSETPPLATNGVTKPADLSATENQADAPAEPAVEIPPSTPAS
jgi:hypothetical protein